MAVVINAPEFYDCNQNICKSASIVKNSYELGSIPSANSHFGFGCCVPFIQARSLRNGTKSTGGPLCVCMPHKQSKDHPVHSLQVVADQYRFRSSIAYAALQRV